MKFFTCIALLLALVGCGGGTGSESESGLRVATAAALLKLDMMPSTSKAVFVHGGGWVAGNPDSVRPIAKRFAAWGYGIDSAAYRLIPEVDLATEVGDVAAQIELTRSDSTAPTIVVGHSAGAHLAATAVLQANAGKPMCLILLDGIGYDLPDLLTRRPALQDRLMLTPQQALPWSPVALLGPEDVPVRTFIAAGNDSRDTKGEGERMAAAASAAGVPVEFHYYPNMDHQAFLLQFTEAPPSEFLKAVARFVDGCAWRTTQ